MDVTTIFISQFFLYCHWYYSNWFLQKYLEISIVFFSFLILNGFPSSEGHNPKNIFHLSVRTSRFLSNLTELKIPTFSTFREKTRFPLQKVEKIWGYLSYLSMISIILFHNCCSPIQYIHWSFQKCGDQDSKIIVMIEK